MSRIVLSLIFILHLAAKQNVDAQTTTDSKQQYASMGDFPLENGQHIKFAGLTKAVLVVMDNDLGHLIFNEKAVTEATRTFFSQ